VITGDANLSEISTYLKVGSASWVLRVIEAGSSATICDSRRRGGHAGGQPRPSCRSR
jgi:NAD(P)H-dependent flavin oxidoreductase YrpB (nitropropane dioxygenase family)